MTMELTPTQRDFRAAMSNLSVGVNIVTTNGAAGRAGITVSAVCSVTDSPPTMLVCVNRNARSHDSYVTNGRLAINVLGTAHEDVALTFAGATGLVGEDKFSTELWDESISDVPVLRGAAATVIGSVISVSEQGSHSVLFVDVDRVLSSEDTGALVYFRRTFHQITPQPAS